ncbi:MAG: bifunctional diaminohydroxyphosphoribosylaminopyrimidine deaminase/5-amino-6-(5-phosphoribosylamino)uracil reductase RibD [Fimbriimonadaceae bacterium]
MSEKPDPTSEASGRRDPSPPMLRAIRLAKRGWPAPNPRVGCVIVRDGEIVGEGWHPYAGGPHAEVVALVRAGPRAAGADVFVTLEPCNHYGRTPPCTRALIDAGVARVVVANRDPNPKVAGGGGEALRAVGITVEFGDGATEAAEVNRRWLKAVEQGRPFVVLKAAVSFDGRIALPNGESKWITSEASRRAAHRLRAELGAVVVGRRTVEIDQPLLTARIPGVRRQPLAVVLDPRCKLSGREACLSDPDRAVWVVGEERTRAADPRQVPVPLIEGRLDLAVLLQILYERGVTGVLVEGGARTASAFLSAGLVDELDLFVAPMLLGDGPSWLEGLRLEGLAAAPRLTDPKVRRVGPDLWIRAELRR